MGELNNRRLLLTVLEAVKTEVLADLVSGESPLLGWQIKFLAVCSLAFVVFSFSGWREEGLWDTFSS